MVDRQKTWSVDFKAVQEIPEDEGWPSRVEDQLRAAGAESASVTTSQDLAWLNARVWVRAGRPSRAVAAAERILAHVLPGATLVRGEAMTEAEFDLELQTPVLPEIVGPQEMAARLEISRQRLYELMRRPDFPQPIVQLAIGPVWLGTSINHFVEQWDRKPGRPRKSTPEPMDLITALKAGVGASMRSEKQHAGKPRRRRQVRRTS
jgi:predicted DNA-binding transcriptional regulator AlpA